MNDGNFLLTLLIIFFMVFYFILLFMVLLDIFRDHKMSGWIKLLWILADEAGRTLTSEEIFERVWGGARPDGDRSVDVLVRRLRAKVDEGGGGYTYVQTELRRGYRLQAVPRAFPLHGRRRR